MKIRTDFVTNSSSSSFSVVIAISDTDGNNYELEVNPADEYCGGGGEAFLNVKEKKLFASESVDSLLQYLTEHIVFEDGEDFFDELDEDIECEEYSVKAIRRIFNKHKDLYRQILEEKTDPYFPRALNDIDSFCNQVKMSVPDISQVASVRIDSVHSAWGEFCDLIEEYLCRIGIDIPEEDDSWIEGKTFAITGKLQYFENRDELVEYIEDNGGNVSGSVSPKTDYLINNDLDSASSKNKKAIQLGVPIISEKDFIQRFADELDDEILEEAGGLLAYQDRVVAFLRERLTEDSDFEEIACCCEEFCEPGAFTGKVSMLYEMAKKTVQRTITISDVEP